MRPELLDLVGGTPLARVTTPLPHQHAGFWAKLECLGAGGMKARAAVSMLMAARADGRLAPGAPVVESTSGTLGLGLAFAGQALGHPVVLVVDDELEPVMRALLTAHGARLEVVTRPHPTGGWQRARLDRLHAVLAELPGAHWPDQYDNPANPTGYAALARELLDQLDRIDVLVCSVGTGGHSAGVAGELRRHRPGLRLIGVDSVGSTIFGLPALPRVMRGLGSSIHPRNVAYREFDEVHWLGPVEVVAACRALARDGFVSGGWSTGAVATVAAWVARVEPGAVVVTVFPDGVHRYLDTIFDDGFCRARGLLGRPSDHPVEVADPAAAPLSRWSRCTVVTDPLGVPA
ncbi:PLP-dependent cysteine synthase family protein [Actinokineospora cianjurensis]|uniref:Cysteine synthase A n=1 Tax=Actinokineospora cianjurensis TaxID=585224 RepID=A0A421B4L3_9PSEU|nr:PLP-dependent cysteine synthase family protein [Actinokineospora cianjurensis]RLK59321.1 cysteine synthase A [Actinokineospora cianjurensis]